MPTIAQDLLESMQFMVDHLEGKVVGRAHKVEVADDVDAKAIRKGLDMTQEVFAQTFQLDIGAVRTRGAKAARLYLKVIAQNPQAMMAAIAA